MMEATTTLTCSGVLCRHFNRQRTICAAAEFERARTKSGLGVKETADGLACVQVLNFYIPHPRRYRLASPGSPA